jgi:isoleucyl-tRNA synthetase
VTDKYCADILRYYICETRAGETINFNWESVKQKQRNLIVFWNLSNLLIDMKKNKKKGKECVEERYMLSRLNSSIKKATELFEEYRIDETITEIERLFLDLSRIYIQLNRERSDEIAVYEALKEVYLNCLKLFSVICPFITESIWQNLRKNEIVKEESVHLCSWPEADKKKIDKKLEGEFEKALKIIELGLAERDKSKIGLRWPLAKAVISYHVKLDKKLEEIIARQLNVKKIEWKDAHEKDWKIEFDTKITPELEAEGYAREIARKIQAERKNAGLKKGELIDIKLNVDRELSTMLEQHFKFLKERTNSRNIEITVGNPDMMNVVFTLKEKKVGLELCNFSGALRKDLNSRTS